MAEPVLYVYVYCPRICSSIHLTRMRLAEADLSSKRKTHVDRRCDTASLQQYKYCAGSLSLSCSDSLVTIRQQASKARTHEHTNTQIHTALESELFDSTPNSPAAILSTQYSVPNT